MANVLAMLCFTAENKAATYHSLLTSQRCFMAHLVRPHEEVEWQGRNMSLSHNPLRDAPWLSLRATGGNSSAANVLSMLHTRAVRTAVAASTMKVSRRMPRGSG